MKNILCILFLFCSILSYSQNKQPYKIGIFGSVYRSNLYIKTTLKNGTPPSKYFPSWDPLPLCGGYGVTVSRISHKVWYNALSLESRTIGFWYTIGTARYRYLISKLSTGIKYKDFKINIGAGIGKSYNKVFDDGSGKQKTNTGYLNNNKSIIIPFDIEFGLSTYVIDINLIGQTIWGELFKNMVEYDTRVYNYPYNLGIKFTYWIKK